MEFKRLADVEALTEIPEGANAFVEVNGEIKRVPGEGLGGAGGFKTAVIKSSIYDEALNYAINPRAGLSISYSCINMTFEEAFTTLVSGEVLKATLMDAQEGVPFICDLIVNFLGMLPGEPCIQLFNPFVEIGLYWTLNGISTEAPSGGK